MYNTNAPIHLSDASTDHAPVISGQLQQVLSVEENPSASSQTLNLRVILRYQSAELTSRRGRRHPSVLLLVLMLVYVVSFNLQNSKSERLRAGVLPPSLRLCVVMMTESLSGAAQVRQRSSLSYMTSTWRVKTSQSPRLESKRFFHGWIFYSGTVTEAGSVAWWGRGRRADFFSFFLNWRANRLHLKGMEEEKEEEEEEEYPCGGFQSLFLHYCCSGVFRLLFNISFHLFFSFFFKGREEEAGSCQSSSLSPTQHSRQ